MVSEEALRAELARISCPTAYDRDRVRGSGGNVSARLGARHLLITPSGVTLDDTTIDNIIEVDLSSSELVGQKSYVPSKEYRFHAKVYATRRDVNAIVHCHPPHATAYAVCKADI